jgi:hypothetical protein
MVYGNGYMGVTEANYAVVLVHLITGIIAPFRWLYHPFAALARSSLASQLLPPAAADFLATVQLNDFAVVWISSMAASLLVQQVVRVFRLSGSPVLEHTTLPIKERGHKQLGKWRAAWHLLQLLSFFVLGGVLVTLPGFAPGQGRVAFATFGVAYAMQVGSCLLHVHSRLWLCVVVCVCAHRLARCRIRCQKCTHSITAHVPLPPATSLLAIVLGSACTLLHSTHVLAWLACVSFAHTRACFLLSPQLRLSSCLGSRLSSLPPLLALLPPPLSSSLLLQATKFIMAHMSKEPFSMTAWPLMLMAFQVGARGLAGWQAGRLAGWMACVCMCVRGLGGLGAKGGEGGA